LEALKQCPHFEVWRDPKFQIAAAVGHIVEGGIADPEKLIGASCLYSSPGTRALQIDAFVFNKNTRILGAYEIKRGGGLHDSGKRRSMLKDTLSVQILLKSYGKERGYDSENAFSHIIFYYGECSIPKPFGLAGDEIDKHFEWPVFGAVDEVNQYFRIRLAPILDAITA
jgi:hypothetical protein